jgi:hypothetical protein
MHFELLRFAEFNVLNVKKIDRLCIEGFTVCGGGAEASKERKYGVANKKHPASNSNDAINFMTKHYQTQTVFVKCKKIT